jgi:ketosteroid isomerase-like protein
MRSPLFATIVACAVTGLALGQDAIHHEALEQTIRKLELEESAAVLRSDVAALERLWAEDFTVNSPQNRVSQGRKDVLQLVRSGSIKYSSFVREIEAVRLHGNTAVVMGSEQVTPVGNAPNAGETVRRRYTNIWMNKQGTWLLTARHANALCEH